MNNKNSSKAPKYPFVTPDSMNEMMQFVRHPTWKQDVSTPLLKKMGIATNNEGKITGALKFLGITDNSGVPTTEFDELKKNYQATLNRLVQTAYKELFDTFTPEMITRSRLMSFFGEPHQGAERRSRLFIWLCKEAGIELPNLNDSNHYNSRN